MSWWLLDPLFLAGTVPILNPELMGVGAGAGADAAGAEPPNANDGAGDGAGVAPAPVNPLNPAKGLEFFCGAPPPPPPPPPPALRRALTILRPAS